jgi:quinol monooxygenase YgiN
LSGGLGLEAEGAETSKPVTAIVRLRLAAGTESAFTAIAKRLMREVMQNEPGCLEFNPQRALGEAGGFVIVARFVSMKALEAHWTSEHLKRALDDGVALAAGPPELELLQDV